MGTRIGCIAVWLSFLAFSTARADPPEDTISARRHFYRGERLYAVGKFQAALEAFTAAYEAAAKPGLLFNIGQCHRRLGHTDEAIFFFNGFLQGDPKADQKEIAALIAEQQEVKRTRAAAVALTARPPPSPSTETPSTSPPPTVATPLLLPLPVRQPVKTPTYKKWWPWTIAAVVVAGAVTATAVGVTTTTSHLPGGKLGSIDAR